MEFIEQLEKPLEAKILLDVVCNSEPETSLTKSFLLEIRVSCQILLKSMSIFVFFILKMNSIINVFL